MITTLKQVISILISHYQFQSLSNNPLKKKFSFIFRFINYFTSEYGLFVTIIFGRKLYILIFFSNLVLRSSTDSNEHRCIGQIS